MNEQTTTNTEDTIGLNGSSVLARVVQLAELLNEATDLLSVERVGDALRCCDLKMLALIHQKMNESIEKIDRSKKDMQKTYDWLRHSVMVDKMDDAGIESFTVPGVGRVYMSSSINASIRAGAKDGAYLWLSDHGHADLIQNTVNSSSLKALAKTLIADNDGLPEELFNVSPKTYVAIQKK